jgi:hypothetical protein
MLAWKLTLRITAVFEIAIYILRILMPLTPCKERAVRHFCTNIYLYHMGTKYRPLSFRENAREHHSSRFLPPFLCYILDLIYSTDLPIPVNIITTQTFSRKIVKRKWQKYLECPGVLLLFYCIHFCIIFSFPYLFLPSSAPRSLHFLFTPSCGVVVMTDISTTSCCYTYEKLHVRARSWAR